jgi:hypothetical protein
VARPGAVRLQGTHLFRAARLPRPTLAGGPSRGPCRRGGPAGRACLHKQETGTAGQPVARARTHTPRHRPQRCARLACGVVDERAVASAQLPPVSQALGAQLCGAAAAVVVAHLDERRECYRDGCIPQAPRRGLALSAATLASSRHKTSLRALRPPVRVSPWLAKQCCFAAASAGERPASAARSSLRQGLQTLPAACRLPP